MSRQKKLILAGAGHAHLTTLKNLKRFVDRGHEVAVVSLEDRHYYSGMGPGMLSGIYRPEEIRIDVKRMTESRGGRFIQGKVEGIDPRSRRLFLAGGDVLPYDVVSFNTGSGIPFSVPDNAQSIAFPVKPIQNLLAARNRIIEGLKEKEGLKKKTLDIAVVGGGAAGIEIAGNVWRLVRERKGTARIRLYSGFRMAPRFDSAVRLKALHSLERRNISIRENIRAASIDGRWLRLADGTLEAADVVFLAAGVQPSDLFRKSGLPVGEEGGLLVDESLRSTAHPEIFGGGDCIAFAPSPLPKIGIHAVRQNPILLHNLMAALEDRPLKPFTPQKKYMLILNMGDDTGILFRDRVVFRGRLAWRLKDWIDRRFIRRFQAAEAGG